MCRIFGFRSVLQSGVHRSLLHADNALAQQSTKHPDGWGVAYYLARSPHVLKSTATAIDDHIFARVSGIVASETVLAHIRQATTGDVNILNSHPFQFGNWVFAHNGQIYRFAEHREWLVAQIAPTLRRYILGSTDSEVLFFLILTELNRRTELHRRGTPLSDVHEAVRAAVALVIDRCDGPGDDEKSLLTIVITDGNTMLGLCHRKPLSFSTHKSRCLDRDSCPFLAAECEAVTTSGHVNHLILSSEQLQGENVWSELSDGDVVAVDWRMILHTAAQHGELVIAAG